MLVLTVLGEEHYNEENNEFIVLGGYRLELEHSLVSLSKWEEKYKKPFLTQDEKTPEEILYYIKCMAVRPDVPEEVFQGLAREHLKEINEYMNDPMTATWFNEPKNQKPSSEIITNELIYFWMSGFGFPMEMQYWHLNRLFTALKVANVKNQPAKKKSKAEIYAEMRQKNEKMRQQYEKDG